MAVELKGTMYNGRVAEPWHIRVSFLTPFSGDFGLVLVIDIKHYFSLLAPPDAGIEHEEHRHVIRAEPYTQEEMRRAAYNVARALNSIVAYMIRLELIP